MKETKYCPVCQKLFLPNRADAIYCSSACRQSAFRRKTNRTRREGQANYVELRKRAFSLSDRQRRALALELIQQLPDNERSKLYDAIFDDIYRIRYDKT